MNNISPVNCNSFSSFKDNVVLQKQQLKQNVSKKIETNNDIVLKYPPVVIGLMNTGCWAFAGFAFDRFASKIFKTNINPKTSLVINGLLGGAMGVYSYNQAKKLQKPNSGNSVSKF